MKHIEVKDWTKFAAFKYEQAEANEFFLGQVLKKVTPDGTQIGVVIQLHEEAMECRTDMWGNCHADEVEQPTYEEIMLHRPALWKELRLYLDVKIEDSAIYVKRPLDENWALLCLCPSRNIAYRLHRTLYNKIDCSVGAIDNWESMFAAYE